MLQLIFLCHVIFVLLLFLGMKLKQKKNKNYLR